MYGIQARQGAAEYVTICRMLLSLIQHSHDREGSLRSVSHATLIQANVVEDVSVALLTAFKHVGRVETGSGVG